LVDSSQILVKIATVLIKVLTFMFGSGNSETRIKMTKTRVSPRKVTAFVQGLKATRLKKEAVKRLRLKTCQLNAAKLAKPEVVQPLTTSTISTVIQLGLQLLDRRNEMSNSFHPADDDPPPVYTAQAFQNCLDIGNSWINSIRRIWMNFSTRSAT
jgi:hypothetical protein